MVDTVRMDHGPEAVDVAIGEDLLQGPPGDRFEIFGHDWLLPRRLRVTAAPLR
jgi:hypothetical protein